MNYERASHLAAGVLLASAFGLASCHKQPEANVSVTSVPPLVAVAEIQPGRSPLRAFTGTVTARTQSDLGFRVTGKVVERLVDVGQRVHAGQVVMRLDPVDLDLALASRNFELEAVRAKRVQATASEKRLASLVGEHAVSRSEYDVAKAAADDAIASVSAAEAQVNLAKNAQGYAVLMADRDGTVVATWAEPGQVVQPGQAVVSLAHAGAREAKVSFPENIRPAIGSVAEVSLYGRDGTGQCRLRELSDSADALSRTFDARYVLEGEAAEAPLGSTLTLRVPAGLGQDGVFVPIGALHDSGNGPGVWKIDEHSLKVSFQPVILRRLEEERALVAADVPAGTRIVALGAHLLHDGELVRMGVEGPVK